MKLSEHLCEAGISLDLSADNKSEAISALVKLLSGVTPINDASSIIKMLEERENLKTTGIGLGVAMPHCKTSQVGKINVVFGISRKGLDFKALDNKPSQFFFLLAAPEKAGSEHLKMSAKIIRFIREVSVREELMELDSAKDIMNYIRSKEREL